MFDTNKKLKRTIKYFKENNIQEIYPCHCVSLDAKIEIGETLKIKEVGVGLQLEI